MISLIITILILILAFVIMKVNPLFSGFIAVIPVKIIGTGFMAFESSKEALQSSIEGMLIGQFLVGFILLGVYLYLKQS